LSADDPTPGTVTSSGAVVGARAARLARQVRDPQLEVITQRVAGVDRAPPRIENRQTVEQFAARAAEQIPHRHARQR
jgi:hypothetical protein